MNNRWLKYCLPSYLYAALIFISSSLALPVPPIAGRWSDKLMHAVSYSVFGALLARSFRHASTDAWKRNFILLAFLAGGIYGITDEIHQLFVPNRRFEIADMAVDFAGSLIGALIYSRWQLKRTVCP